MKKVIKNTIIVIYAAIAIFVTICLLSFNDYRVTVFGNESLVIIDNKKLEPEFSKGDLVIVGGSLKLEVEIGEKVFFYNTYEKVISISVAEVIDKEVISSREVTYMLEGDRAISSEYIIGQTSETTRIPVVGTILGVLESQWGFLILVVLPALIALLYEIFEVVGEARKNSGNKGKNGSKKEE